MKSGNDSHGPVSCPVGGATFVVNAYHSFKGLLPVKKVHCQRFAGNLNPTNQKYKITCSHKLNEDYMKINQTAQKSPAWHNNRTSEI